MNIYVVYSTQGKKPFKRKRLSKELNIQLHQIKIQLIYSESA